MSLARNFSIGEQSIQHEISFYLRPNLALQISTTNASSREDIDTLQVGTKGCMLALSLLMKRSKYSVSILWQLQDGSILMYMYAYFYSNTCSVFKRKRNDINELPSFPVNHIDKQRTRTNTTIMGRKDISRQYPDNSHCVSI